MGLLEKAYQYKKEINRQGKETLIDTIKGPAETDFSDQETDNNDRNDMELPSGDHGNSRTSGPTIGDDDRDDSAAGVSEMDTAIEDVEGVPGDVPENNITDPDSGKDDLLPVDMDSFELSEHDINMYKDTTVSVKPDDDMGARAVPDENEDYDLFSLPEDDESPLDVLEKQKSGKDITAGDDFSDEEMIAGEADARQSTGYKLSEDDPFGIEDEPVLSPPSKQQEINHDAAQAGHTENVKNNNMDEGTHSVDPQPLTRNSEQNYHEEDDEVINTDNGMRAGGRRAADDAPDVLPDDSGDPVSGDVSPRKDKKFQDFIVLYEIGKEILRSETRKQLYDVILFSIMGQIGASSSSIMIADSNVEKRWRIGDSRGVTIRNKDLSFDIEDDILKKLINEKDIIDLEYHKADQRNKDEYYKFVSIDGRLVSPLNYNGKIIGAVVLGDKITIGDYSEEEKDFILSVSEISAIALHKINTIESLQRINETQKNELALVTHVDDIKEKLISDTSISRLKDVIREEFNNLGVISYAAFLKSDRFDEYTVILNDADDVLGFRENSFSIPYGHPFVEYVNELKGSVKIDDFKRMKVFADTFSERQKNLMTYLWIYPFKMGNHLEGFFIVTDINDSTRENEVHSKISRLTMVLFSYILNIRNLDTHELMYVDYVEPVMKRIERELSNAKNLRIPLTVILFSIKNFKRYYSLFGKDEANKVLYSLEGIIRSRLADPDFSVRYDRNKFLIILPGKNKKYSIPLANTIRNEVLQSYKRKEMQLLVTFLTAEFPEDGNDINALMDSVD